MIDRRSCQTRAGRKPPIRAGQETAEIARLPAPQAMPENQYIQGHHRDHGECNYVFHFVHLTFHCKYNQRRGDPNGRTDNRVSWDEDSHHLLL